LAKHISQISFELKRNPTKSREILGNVNIIALLPYCLEQETQPDRLMINLMLQVDLEALDDCYEVVKQMKEGK
jgi:homoserine trans-succinylase